MPCRRLRNASPITGNSFASHRRMEQLADLAEHCRQQQRLLAHQYGCTLGPTRRDIRHSQRLHKAAPGNRTVMRDQVRFHKAGWRAPDLSPQ
jgi:hypothetical protein